MFDLSRFSNKTTTKFGLAVTILVFTAACAHETIPAQTEASNDITNVSEPLTVPASPLSGSSVKKSSNQGQRRHSAKLAKHKVRKGHHSLQARNTLKHKTKKTQTVQAAAAQVEHQNFPPPPAPRVPITSFLSQQTPAPVGILSRLESYWAWALIALGAGAIFWVSSKSLRPKKGKGRRLVFNS